MTISEPRATINCDIGEGYYRWNLGPDEELLKLVDYANIACGFHAGDHATMLRTVRAGIKYGVKIGAHPGLDDIKGFGRRRLDVTPDEVYSGALYQLGALKAIVEAEGGKMSHVKPHGMLWFILRDSVDLMRAFMKAQTAIFGTSIPMLGCENSAHDQVCAEAGVPFIPEIFADIDYNAEGRNLGVPESKAPTPELITKKLERVFTKQETYDVNGNPVALPCTHKVFSLCLHSDMPTALANVQAARAVFDRYKDQA